MRIELTRLRLKIEFGCLARCLAFADHLAGVYIRGCLEPAYCGRRPARSSEARFHSLSSEALVLRF